MKKGFTAIFISILILIILISVFFTLAISYKNRNISNKQANNYQQNENPPAKSPIQQNNIFNPQSLKPNSQILILQDPKNEKFKIYQDSKFVAECGNTNFFQISNDNKSIIYTNYSSNNIFLIRDNCNSEIQLTRDGVLGNNVYYGAVATPIGFSPDASQFIYLLKNDICLGDCITSAKINLDIKEGYYLYTINSQNSQYLTKEFEYPYTYLGWPEDSQYPIFSKRANYTGQLYQLNTQTKQFIPLTQKMADFSWAMQVEFETHKSILWAGVLHPNNQENGLSQVKLSNWDRSRELDISPLGSFAEYQWPSLSPDGKKIKYIHQYQDYSDKPGNPSDHLEIFDMETKTTTDYGKIGQNSLTQWYSPDTVLFSSYYTKGQNVYSVDLNTKEMKLFMPDAFVLSHL